MKSLVNDNGTTLVFRDISLADTYGQGSWHKPEPAVSGICAEVVETVEVKKTTKAKAGTTLDKKYKK